MGLHITPSQPIDGDLTAIAALAGTSGLLKKTAADAWTLDTSTYATTEQLVGKTNMYGFPVDANGNYLCTLTYNETTRTVTLTPTASTFDVIVGGVRYTKTGAQSITHLATGSSHYIYYNSSGTLVVATSPWDLLSTAPVCFVFQDVTNSRRLPFEERHHAGRDVYWHRNQHAAEGTKATGSGFVATGYTLSTTGDSANTFGISSGRLEDEDIQIDTEALPDGGPYFAMRRSGAAGDWILDRANTVPFYRTGTNTQYNQYTGATWQLTALANNDYVNYYLFGVTALPQASITPAPGVVQQFVIVPGQQVFTSSAAASADTIASLAWGAIPFQEIVPIYRLTYRYSAASGGTSQLISITRVIGTNANITAASITDHGALSGLSDQDHPASAIIYTPAGSIAATDVQAAITELDSEKVSLSLKDATGGYAGLTLFKLNLRNAANTITSWFTTAATVARTWTMPDKDGTVAMTSDITAANAGALPIGGGTLTGPLTGTIAIAEATIATNAALNSRLTQGADNTRYGFNNILYINNTETLTAARNHYGALNTVETQLDNTAAFGSNTIGSYNIGRSQFGAGNVDGYGAVYGSYNVGQHSTYNQTRPRVESVYGLMAQAVATSTTLSLSVTTVDTSTTATTTDTSNIIVGAVISGHAGIPASTTVVSITDAITFEMSAAATNSSTDTTTVFTQSCAYVDSAYGVYSLARPQYAGATINTGYLFYGTNSTVTGTFNNRWGVYIASAINNYLAGGLQIGGSVTGSTTAAGLRIGHNESVNLGSIGTVGLSVAGTSTAVHNAAIVRYYTGTTGPTLFLGRSNSTTLGTNVLVPAGNTLGTIDFRGADGTDFRQGATISAVTEGTPAASSMPTGLYFATTTTGATTAVTRAYIDNAGELTSILPAGNKGQFRLKSANTTSGYGIVHRYDGTTYYLLSTALDDANGVWNANRPFSYTPAANTITTNSAWTFSSTITSGYNIAGKIVHIENGGPMLVGSYDTALHGTGYGGISYIPTTQSFLFSGHSLTGSIDVLNINASGTVTITNTGTGNSLVIADVASDTTPIVATADGQFIIGATAGSAGVNSQIEQLEIVGTGAASSSLGLYSVSDSNPGNSRQYRKRTTGAVASGDGLGQNSWFGYDGTQYKNAATISITVDGTVATDSVPTRIGIFTTSVGATSFTERVRIDGHVLAMNSSILGYATTSGGTVTQATSRTTGVTLSKPSGAITLFSTTTTAGQVTTFTVTNTLVIASDTVVVSQKSGTGIYFAAVTNVAAGSFNISIHTPAAVIGAEAPVFNFAIVRGATA